MRGDDVSWIIKPDLNDSYTNEQVSLLILMDIRRELRRLNGLLSCHNFKDIPHKLDKIVKHTKRAKRKKKKPIDHPTKN